MRLRTMELPRAYDGERGIAPPFVVVFDRLPEDAAITNQVVEVLRERVQQQTGAAGVIVFGQMFGDVQIGDDPDPEQVAPDVLAQISTILGETCGQVSCCWSNMALAGEFDSGQASKAVDRGVERVAAVLRGEDDPGGQRSAPTISGVAELIGDGCSVEVGGWRLKADRVDTYGNPLNGPDDRKAAG